MQTRTQYILHAFAYRKYVQILVFLLRLQITVQSTFIYILLHFWCPCKSRLCNCNLSYSVPDKSFLFLFFSKIFSHFHNSPISFSLRGVADESLGLSSGSDKNRKAESDRTVQSDTLSTWFQYSHFGENLPWSWSYKTASRNDQNPARGRS